MFDFNKIGDFDNHINLSIPNYDSLSDIFSHLVYEFMPNNGVCVDIGCSTGRFLNDLIKSDSGIYFGVDSVIMESEKNFQYINGDIFDFLKKQQTLDIIVSMFTLQFLSGKNRTKVVSQIEKHIQNGAVLLVAEKIFINNARVNHTLHRAHIHQKRKGFTDTEILDKDEKLFGSMFCKTDSELKKELEAIGNVSPVWQSYNFVGYFVNV